MSTFYARAYGSTKSPLLTFKYPKAIITTFKQLAANSTYRNDVGTSIDGWHGYIADTGSNLAKIKYKYDARTSYTTSDIYDNTSGSVTRVETSATIVAGRTYDK